MKTVFILTLFVISESKTFFELARDGDFQEVQICLFHNTHPDIVDNNGYTALLHAAVNGKRRTLESLLSFNASMNLGDHRGYTPLMGAIKNSHFDLVEILLKRGANPSAQDTKKRTALIIASMDSNSEMVKLLLRYGADPNILDDNKRGPLSYAVSLNDDKIVELLLQYNASVNNIDKYGDTPLMILAQTRLWFKGPRDLQPFEKQSKILRVLIEKGADVFVFNRRSISIMRLACQSGNISIFFKLASMGLKERCYFRSPDFYMIE